MGAVVAVAGVVGEGIEGQENLPLRMGRSAHGSGLALWSAAGRAIARHAALELTASCAGEVSIQGSRP